MRTILGFCGPFDGRRCWHTGCDGSDGTLMDAITLALLNQWVDQHQTECGVHRFDVVVDRDDAHNMRVALVCPMCRGTISGTIAETERTTLLSLLESVSQD
jgi:hypothetical protein